MKVSLYIDNLQSLDNFKNTDLDIELIVAPKGLSRFGSFPVQDIKALLGAASEQNQSVSLELDKIVLEKDLESFISEIEDLPLSSFSSLRVIDPGIAYYFKQQDYQNISFIAEMGNHNLEALKTWENYFGKNLKQIVLCPELPEDKINSFSKSLSTPTELLAFGKILLFYSPRSLLTHFYDDPNDPQQKAQLSSDFLFLNANSEESPHKGFGIVETPAGSFMFNPKDLCLLDYYTDLKASGLKSLRLDLRGLNGETKCLDEALSFLSSPTAENLDQFKKAWSKPLIRGFFKANKSDVLFKNLKNTDNQVLDEDYLGDVIETLSGSHLVLEVKNPKRILREGDRISFKTPDKKWRNFTASNLKNLSGESVNSVAKGNYAVLAFTNGVSSKTRVYFS